MTPAEYEQLIEFLGRQFTQIDHRFDQIGGQIVRLDGQVVRLDGQIVRLDGQIVELRGEMTELRGEMTELRGEILGHFDEICRRLERLEQEYHAITQALRRIEAYLSDESGRREILERDLAELKQQVAALQSRIKDIEQRLGRYYNSPAVRVPGHLIGRSRIP